jgi:hypothetical protein
MTLEIQILVFGKAEKFGGFKSVNGILTLPSQPSSLFITWSSTENADINKR